jgi:hypothetical protein
MNFQFNQLRHCQWEYLEGAQGATWLKRLERENRCGFFDRLIIRTLYLRLQTIKLFLLICQVGWTYRQTDRQSYRQTVRHAEGQIDRQTERYICEMTDELVEGQTKRTTITDWQTKVQIEGRDQVGKRTDGCSVHSQTVVSDLGAIIMNLFSVITKFCTKLEHLLDLAGNASQGQTLQFITKIRKLRTNRFITLGPFDRK